MSDNRTPVERVVEIAIHVPVGIAAFARDAVPTLVTMFAGRGKREVDVHQREVVGQLANYKAIGELAVKFGPPVVRQRVTEQIVTLRTKSLEAFESFSSSSRTCSGVTDLHSSSENQIAEDASDLVDIKAGGEPVPSQSEAAMQGESPHVEAPGSESLTLESALLSIPDYDGLAASQVIERLEGLNSEELNDVENYERSTRARRTILGKIAILRTT